MGFCELALVEHSPFIRDYIAMTNEEKIRTLLGSLSSELCERLLRQMAPRASQSLRELMTGSGKTSTSPEQAEKVMQELDELLQRVQQKEKEKDRAREDLSPADLLRSPGEAHHRYKEQFDSTRHQSEEHNSPPPKTPVHALRSQDLETLYFALEDEKPRTIAVILGLLTDSGAAELLRRFSSTLRCQISVQMTATIQLSPAIMQQMAQAVVEKCQNIEQGNFLLSAEGRFRRMALMMAQLNQHEQMEIISALEQQDPQAAARVREHLGLPDQNG